MADYFDFRNLKHMSHGAAPVVVEHDPDSELHGVRTLSDQIRSYRHGLCNLPSRELGDSNYDEDDETEVDPSFDPSLDRFERAEVMSQRISERMKKKKEEELSHAEA